MEEAEHWSSQNKIQGDILFSSLSFLDKLLYHLKRGTDLISNEAVPRSHTQGTLERFS